MGHRPFAHLSLALCLGSVLRGAPPSLPARVRDLLGVPYVQDAVRDPAGRWTTFARPGLGLDRPGLNCSGLTYAIAVRLLGCRLGPAEAGRDRLGDSGADSPRGRDWDFGLDLVLNLSEGLPRRVVMPRGYVPVPGDGRGFAVDDPAAWAAVLPRLRRDRVYLATLSRPAPLQHYHTATILADASGIWFYHTLPGGRSQRLDLATPAGMARMRRAFGSGKRVLLVEVEPPLG